MQKHITRSIGFYKQHSQNAHTLTKQKQKTKEKTERQTKQSKKKETKKQRKSTLHDKILRKKEIASS